MPRFDVDETVKALKRTRPTFLPGVPTLYTALLDHEGVTKDTLSSVQYGISGGAALPLEVREGV